MVGTGARSVKIEEQPDVRDLLDEGSRWGNIAAVCSDTKYFLELLRGRDTLVGEENQKPLRCDKCVRLPHELVEFRVRHPLQIDSDPAFDADIRRNKKPFGVGLYQDLLYSQRRIAPERVAPRSVMRRGACIHREQPLPRTPRRLSPGHLLHCLRESRDPPLLRNPGR